MWDGNLRNLLRCVTSKSCLNKILAWNLQDEMRLILIWFSMLSKWFCNFFGTSGKSLLWLYASVQLVLFMSETHEQVQLQSQHIYPSVKLCSAQRKCKKPQELHLRLYRPQFFLNVKLHNSTIRKNVSHSKGFPGESLFSLQRTWQKVCKAAFKQTTRLLDGQDPGGDVGQCTTPHLVKIKNSIHKHFILTVQHGSGKVRIWYNFQVIGAKVGSTSYWIMRFT